MGTFTISEDSQFVRFFIWSWEADPKKLNICKIFWGTIFLPFAFFIKLITIRVFHYFSLVPLILCATVIAYLVQGRWWGAVSITVLTLIISWQEYARYRRDLKLEPIKISFYNKPLEKWTERGSRIGDWIFEHTLVRLFELIEISIDSKTGERLSGFISIATAYISAVKHRYCPEVRVESES